MVNTRRGEVNALCCNPYCVQSWPKRYKKCSGHVFNLHADAFSQKVAVNDLLRSHEAVGTLHVFCEILVKSARIGKCGFEYAKPVRKPRPGIAAGDYFALERMKSPVCRAHVPCHSLPQRASESHGHQSGLPTAQVTCVMYIYLYTSLHV